MRSFGFILLQTLLLASLLPLGGCGEPPLRRLDFTVVDVFIQDPAEQVDILFVIDILFRFVAYR